MSVDCRSANLAPFSYFQVVDDDPLKFVMGLGHRPGRPKDMYRHFKETGECLINIVSENMIPAANVSEGGDFRPATSAQHYGDALEGSGVSLLYRDKVEGHERV